MGLLKADFYRSFAIGFAIGAAALFGSLDDGQRTEVAARLIPQALAASIR